MLVLSRSPGEHITLVLEDGQEIDLMVCEVRNRYVRLGIAAPHSVKAYRSELLAEVRRREAAAPGAPGGAVPPG